MRTLVFAAFVMALTTGGASLLAPQWEAAWFLAASSGTDIPAPPRVGDARVEDLELAGVPTRAEIPAAGGRHPTIVLAHSFTPNGERDVRIDAAMRPLARLGIAVLIPRLDGFVSDRVEPDDVERLVDIFVAAADLPFVDPDRRALAGYSLSAGYALLAAADERIARDVHFVLSVGGYTSASSLFAALVSGEVPTADGIRTWHPDDWAVSLARAELLRRIPAHVRRFFALALQRCTFEEATRLLHEEPAIYGALASLSPIAAAPRVRAPVLLLHGVDDPVVPDEETRALEVALASATTVRSLQTTLLHHANLTDVRGSIGREGPDAAWAMVDAIAWALRRLE